MINNNIDRRCGTCIHYNGNIAQDDWCRVPNRHNDTNLNCLSYEARSCRNCQCEGQDTHIICRDRVAHGTTTPCEYWNLKVEREGRTCASCSYLDVLENGEALFCTLNNCNQGKTNDTPACQYHQQRIEGNGRTCGQCLHHHNDETCDRFNRTSIYHTDDFASRCGDFAPLPRQHQRIPDYHRHTQQNHTINRTYPEKYNFETVQNMEIVWYWNSRLKAPRVKFEPKGKAYPKIGKFPFHEFQCEYDCDVCYRLKEVQPENGNFIGFCTWDYQQIYDFNGEIYFVNTKIIGCKHQLLNKQSLPGVLLPNKFSILLGDPNDHKIMEKPVKFKKINSEQEL